MTLSNNLQGILWVLASTLVWGATNNIIKHVSYTDFHASQILFSIYVFTFLYMLPRQIRVRFSAVRTSQLKLYILRSIFEVGGAFLWFAAITLMPLPTWAALGFTKTLLTVIAAAFLMGEKVNFHIVSMLIAGVIGVIMIVKPEMTISFYGFLLVMGSSLMFTATGLLIRKLSLKDQPYTVTFYMALFTSLFAFPISLIFWKVPSFIELLWFALLGLCCLSGQYSTSKALSKAPIAVVLPFQFFSLIFTTLFAYIFFGEWIDIYTLAGAAIILASAVNIVRFENRKTKGSNAVTDK